MGSLFIHAWVVHVAAPTKIDVKIFMGFTNANAMKFHCKYHRQFTGI